MARLLLSSPTMHEEEMHFVQEAFDTNWIAPLGKNVDSFESEIISYIGGGHAVALSSGTAALHLAVKLCGLKRGDVVFCSDLTFAASVNPVVYEGGVPVFIDAEYDTWNMDPLALERAFQKYPQCRVVIVANLYGTPAKLDEISAICKAHDAILIEDAAESLSSTFRGVQTGTFGKYNALSFNGNKIITTSGGGMLLTNDAAAKDKARFWATQSKDPAPYYQHSEIGYNYRMSNVLAGIGRGQLLHLQEHKAKKCEIYRSYKAGLAGLPLSMNPYLAYSEPNHWLSCVLIDKHCALTPAELIARLDENDMEARHIWKPMHMQPLYANCAFVTVQEAPVSAQIFARGVCLPSDIKMTQQEQVISLIRSMF
ncbi:MAG: aminotransferase class I/II-fold pyridoxal phosphate-dependent enzyme [Oscillospiraceae bacterium]|jgi:dTDP-4-amino-4,6-dideoxygalactose transaminase|nr:aminotransferase class I/II-fold pyridoxal phosphate-dependent enzyme [Oscillospiraceae bacterium]